MSRTILFASAVVLLVGFAVAVAAIPAGEKSIPATETDTTKLTPMLDPFRCIRGPVVSNRNREIPAWEWPGNPFTTENRKALVVRR